MRHGVEITHARDIIPPLNRYIALANDLDKSRAELKRGGKKKLESRYLNSRGPRVSERARMPVIVAANQRGEKHYWVKPNHVSPHKLIRAERDLSF